MPIPQQRDPWQARERLYHWLLERMPQARNLQLSPLTVPEGTGYSNETFMFDASWVERGERRSQALVARVQTTDYSVFMDTDVRRQYEVLNLLAAHTDVPVPKVWWFEADDSVLGSPFFVMDKVPGQVPADVPTYNAQGFLADMSPSEREALWLSAMDVFVRIHQVPRGWPGFRILDPGDGTTSSSLAGYLSYLKRYFEWVARGKDHPVAESAWSWIESHAPRHEDDGLCWGDARISNMIFHGGRCVAVLDWEMATACPVERDLGWWLFLDRFSSEGMGVPRLQGLPGREATISHYEGLLGRRVRDLEFYEVLTGFYFALIMMRIVQMQVRHGTLPEDNDRAINNPVTHLLARMVG